MKNLTLILAFSIICILSFAQAPQGFEYQAVVRDANSNLLVNQAVGVQISINQGSATGTSVYQETFSTTTNQYGLVNLQIGTGVIGGNFSLIDWASGPYFIEIGLDVTGGTNYSVMGASQLLSVPYALHAKTVENNDACNLFTYYYADRDGDGYGDAYNLVFSCNQPTGYVIDNTDCADNDASANPGATEICDGRDNNCDGQIDEGFTPVLQYADSDGDGYGGYNSPSEYWCNLKPGNSLNNTDCNDEIANINPGATEICGDGMDNNCDGVTDGLPCSCSADTDCPSGYECQNGMCLLYGVQMRLDNGETPCQIVGSGIPLDSLYGKNYGGGLIFYFNTSNCTGLTVASSDQSNGIQWYNGNYLITGATATGVGSGQTNTSLIVSAQGAGSYAAKICDDLVLNGYSDWYLPSGFEMNLIESYIVNWGFGNLSSAYWTSNEDSASNAEMYGFNGNGLSASKEILFSVRAIRQF